MVLSHLDKMRLLELKLHFVNMTVKAVIVTNKPVLSDGFGLAFVLSVWSGHSFWEHRGLYRIVLVLALPFAVALFVSPG